MLQPEVVVCLGATAAKALISPSFRITKDRGQLLPWTPPGVAAVDDGTEADDDEPDEGAPAQTWMLATTHPSAILRTPGRGPGRRLRRPGRRPRGGRARPGRDGQRLVRYGPTACLVQTADARPVIASLGVGDPAGHAAERLARNSQNEGTTRATTTIATTMTTPPDTIATVTDAALASAPARRSPSRGPPATTTMNTPCIRPRISSGAAICSIDVRSTALTMSAAPATARQSTASHSAGREPEPDDRHAPDRDRARARRRPAGRPG